MIRMLQKILNLIMIEQPIILIAIMIAIIKKTNAVKTVLNNLEMIEM